MIKQVCQICAGFLSKGKESSTRGARVSWKTVCYPKSEGGLGIKDLSSWNQECILQNICSLITKSGSLWIAWIQTYVLRGRDFWQISAVQNCSWSWRKLLNLRPLALQFVEWENGRIKWKLAGRNYKTSDVWERIRPKQEKVEWHRLLWAPFTVPKCALIAWMAILNRLPTMDRLQAWGLEVTGICVLCKQGIESRDHLFFSCTFSKQIWKGILTLCGLRRAAHGWEEELKWAYKNLKGKSLLSIVLRSAWSAYIYFIWKERNGRLYNSKEETSEQVLEQIKQMIRFRLGGLNNIKPDHINNSLYRAWGLFPTIFCLD